MKKFTEHQVVISKAEYESLIAIRDKFQKAFNAKKTILFVDAQYMGMGYTRDEFFIINPDDIVDTLNQQIKELKDIRHKYYKENEALKDALEKVQKRRWWWL